MPGPAVLQPYDPDWPVRAAQLLTAVREALEPLGVAEAFDHIGSTSVPGLPAKAYVDLQVCVRELPESGVFDEALASIGFVPAVGARPDSPGVHRDVPRGSGVVPDDLWRKRLFVRDINGPGASILHVRLSVSPWPATRCGSATGCALIRRRETATPTSRLRLLPSRPAMATSTTTPAPRRRSSIRCRRSSRRGDVGLRRWRAQVEFRADDGMTVCLRTAGWPEVGMDVAAVSNQWPLVVQPVSPPSVGGAGR